MLIDHRIFRKENTVEMARGSTFIMKINVSKSFLGKEAIEPRPWAKKSPQKKAFL